ncbi:Ribokinase [Anaerohalosphaera lusitana]|uniref:Ribokinase n=1 Tax=Anaerohalosphaera lusitana TaxID=1936003 RepID=A0A1U9NM51_9BACT|nr:PfkB family carbohydrate kinase [Anaerohalosphaera lusitana]AQT68989.1 Ribokinase [Anaerohalosphaera lusitana]
MRPRIPRIVVIGPSYVDMAIKCDTFPSAGESVEGTGFSYIPTGSGVVSAIEASLCDCDVNLISKVGDDCQGQTIRSYLEEKKVSTEFVYTAQAISTGAIVTMVNGTGENMSCVAEGANRSLQVDEIKAAPTEQLISSADACLIRTGVSREIGRAAIQLCKLYQTRVVLELPMETRDETELEFLDWPSDFYDVDVLIPDVSNGSLVSDPAVGIVHNLKFLGSGLVARGVKYVVIKMGHRGCCVVSRDGVDQIRGFSLEGVIEQGASGDAFAGALAASCGAGDQINDAARFAQAACELAGQKFSTPDSLPRKAEIIELLQSQRD